MSVVNINKSDDLDRVISNSSNLTIVHFAAPWASQCSQVSAVLSELTKLSEVQNEGAMFYECDAEKMSDLSLRYKVDSVPTIMLFRNGKQVDRIDGADASQISAKVRSRCGDGLTKTEASTNLQQSLNDRLKELINKHTIMVFMKGNRDQPRCGFSKTLIQILNETGLSYETFDILTDEAVRQGLKEYSDWPTYPQVYVKGELIGGLDIIKELKAGGELEASLQG